MLVFCKMRNPQCFRLNPQCLLVMAPASDKLWHDGSRRLSRLRSPQRRLHAAKAMAGRGVKESDDTEMKKSWRGWNIIMKISTIMYTYGRCTTIFDLISLRMPCFGHHFDNVYRSMTCTATLLFLAVCCHLAWQDHPNGHKRSCWWIHSI